MRIEANMLGTPHVLPPWFDSFMERSSGDLTHLESASIAFQSGDEDRARTLVKEALETPNASAPLLIEALCMLARLALRNRDYKLAKKHADQAYQTAAATADRRQLQTPLHLLAAVDRLDGRLEQARAGYQNSIELNMELGHAGAVAIEQRNLAYVELHLGNTKAALAYFDEARRYSGNRTQYSTSTLLDDAVIAFSRDDLSTASLLFQELKKKLKVAGRLLDPDDEHERILLAKSLHTAPDSD